MSSTKNVKLGVCKIYFNGVDLGLTSGGVDVTVKTQTHKVTVDQFGKTPINEYIMGRDVSVKAPLAETTLNNLVQIMPGATLSTDGAQATAAIAFTAVPVAGNTISITDTNAITTVYTFETVAVGPLEIPIEATLAATLTAAAEVITANMNDGISATATATDLNINYSFYGTAGNTVALAVSGTVMTAPATLTGGTAATYMEVVVPTGIGTNLLSIAKPLVLHPVANAATDHSEDFTVYQAATAGDMSYAYDLTKERVFSCDFTGYPDGQGRLFSVGGYLNS
nr:hypothetical protein [Ferrovum sp.]